MKKELLAFLGWPNCKSERMTILCAMLIFIGFLFSLVKGIYDTCAIHTQVNRQASVARKRFSGFFGIISTSNKNEILVDAQISENNKKLCTKSNTYATPQDNTISTPTAPPHLHSPQNNQTLSLVPQNYRIKLVTTEHNSQGSNFP